MATNAVGRKKVPGRPMQKTTCAGRTFPPNQHDQPASAWTMSPEGSAAKKDAVRDDIIWTMVSGSAAVAICKRYAPFLPARSDHCCIIYSEPGQKHVSSAQVLTHRAKTRDLEQRPARKYQSCGFGFLHNEGDSPRTVLGIHGP